MPSLPFRKIILSKPPLQVLVTANLGTYFINSNLGFKLSYSSDNFKNQKAATLGRNVFDTKAFLDRHLVYCR